MTSPINKKIAEATKDILNIIVTDTSVDNVFLKQNVERRVWLTRPYLLIYKEFNLFIGRQSAGIIMSF